MNMIEFINNNTEIVRGIDVPSIDKFLEEFSLDELWLGGYLKRGTII